MASETSPATATAPDVAKAAGSATGGGDNADAATDTAAQDTASSVDDQVLEKPAPTPTKKQKLKNHCAKFWWVHVLVVLVLLIILLPILFTVIIPAIVQDVVNDQKLPVYDGRLRALSSKSINITLDTMLNTPLEVDVGPMQMTLASNEEEKAPAFLSLAFPKSRVLHKTNLTVPPQRIDILDEDALVGWFTRLFDQDSIEVRVGSPRSKVHLNGLDYHPKLSQVAHLRGLNYLSGFAIQEMHFTIPSEGGYNIRGKLDLPNPGSLALYLGNVTMNLMAGDVQLGLIHVDELTMERGTNHPAFYGNIFFDRLLPNIAEVLSGQGQYLKNGELGLHVSGNTTVINGERVSFVERVLNAKRIPLGIPVTTFVGELLKAMTGSDGGTADLVDVLGGAFGNRTLIDDIMDHWKGSSSASKFSSSSSSGRSKRSNPVTRRPIGRMSLVKNMLKLGLRTRTKSR
ncbi:Protein of unknown function (DUF3712) [Geosmithia morbida]|uniref:Uncharacterized protein n=1 Tax=Geosmithia morbida TaxID=1094350 RepID=A0A9P5D463_9HYPO|nr:Protein of unknown function (DUF3712) [Geosmithia morbida]KAF4126993.1 Protein of unknown function (DUF3712) [Geosmithia morbida]